MMRAGLIGAFLLLAMGSAIATETPDRRLQVSTPGIDYGDFMKLSALERRARFDSLTAENRARIVQTHVKRWLDKNRRHLTAGELAVFEDIVTFLSAESSRTSDGASDKRQDAHSGKDEVPGSPQRMSERQLTCSVRRVARPVKR